MGPCSASAPDTRCAAMADSDDQVWTVLRTLQWTTEYFRSKGAESARLEAELLLAHTLGMERIQLYVAYERPMNSEERSRYRALVRRRGAGEPVAYILGRREFWSLDFEVAPGVLVPRPDTETLVARAIEIAKEMSGQGQEALRAAEVGTGTGCIAIALAHELSELEVWAGDIADVPLEIAPRNAARASLGERVHIMRADGLKPLWEASGALPFDLIVSNPPYLRDDEFSGLMRDVRDFEPREALTSGPEGLDVIIPLIEEAALDDRLRPGGALLIEIGSRAQADVVQGAMRRRGFSSLEIVADLAKRARVVVGRR